MRRTPRRRFSSLFVQPLEDRCVPSATLDRGGVYPTSGVATQFPEIVAAALPPDYAFDERGRRTGAERTRINNALVALFHDDIEPRLPATIDPTLRFDAAGNMLVTITGRDMPGLVPRLQALGYVEVSDAYDRYLTQGYLPVGSLPAVERLSGLGGILPAGQGGTSVGSVTSEAHFVMQTDFVQQFGNGSGARIGVLSDSFNNLGGYAAGKTSGDLPTVNIIEDRIVMPAGSDEGRAMLELIYDIAPGADLLFATGFNNGDEEFAENIGKLADPNQGNANVIVDDLFYGNEPFYQRGVIAQAVAKAYDSGVHYFSSAGNLADQAYENIGFPTATDGTFGTSLDFDPGAGVDTRQRITIPNGKAINFVMQWDQPFYTAAGVTTNVDIRLVSTTGVVLAMSLMDNVANMTPIEFLNYTNSTGAAQAADVVISIASGATPGRVKWVNLGMNRQGPVTINEFATNSSTITPHAAIASVEGVAAAPWSDITGRETFTSKRGNVTLFSDDGKTRFVTPVTEPGPFLTAPDGTTTTVPGFMPFFGTSAAAPHAAAVSAIIRGLRPDFTVGQTYQAMALTADARSSTVPDFAAAGLVRAYDAVASVLNVPRVQPLQVNDGFESGTLQPYFSVHSTGAGHVRVSNADGPQSGSFHVTMASDFGGMFSRNELDLHVNAAGAKNLTLSFGQKEFNDNDHPMPASFSGTSDSDGVAFSVNGTNWFRLVDLTTPTSTNAYQNYSFDLVAAAAAAGVTLSSDTRIRFQQYGAFGLASDGMAFDNISVFRTGSVIGAVTDDANGDGIFQSGEASLPGRTVFLDDNANGLLDRHDVRVFNGGSVAIPDNGTLVESVLSVSGVPANARLNSVRVQVNLAHTYTADLELYLVNPIGAKVQLFNNEGSENDNIVTTFDDRAITPIASGYGNFAGSYRPTQSFSAFTGTQSPFINGNWKLQAVDQVGGDAGTLNNWSLLLTTDGRFSANSGSSISDFSTTSSSIAVSGFTGALNDLEVGVNIDHTAVGDLEIDLVAPNGARATIFNRHGGSGNNLTSTLFDDFASASITSGTAPFIGSFRPNTPLATFNGLSGAALNGLWRLDVRDTRNIDAGTFNDWFIIIGTGEEFRTTDANGNFSFTNQAGPRIVTDVPVIGWRPTDPAFGKPPTIDFTPGFIGVQSFLRQPDTTPATVTVFNANGPHLTSDVFIDYTITFSEPVYGLVRENFILNTDLANAFVNSATPISPSSYTVNVFTGNSGLGTIQPRLINSHNLTDAGYNPVGMGNGTLVTIDRATPVITSITSTSPNDTYGIGKPINLTFNYNEPVTLNGSINVGLNSGAVITLSGPQSGTALTATYIVGGGQASADLNVTGFSLVGSSTLRDIAGNAASFALPTTNLAVSKDIVISTVPAMDSITSNTPAGTYSNNAVIDVRLNFTETVTLSGMLTVTLDTGAVLSITGPQSTATLIGTYLVAPGQTSPDLNVTALNLTGGSTLVGQANKNAVVLSLPASNLAVNEDIVIAGSDVSGPTIGSITSQSPDKTYGVNENIDVRLIFNETVTLQGTLNVTLDTGGVVTINGPLTGTTLAGGYTVAFNQNSADLNVTSMALAVGSTLRDAANNDASLSLPASNLATNKAIVISTPGAPTYVVSKTNDSGPGSLRQAILDSNFSIGFNTITFDSSFNTARTITLASEIGITDTVTIVGPGAGLLTISGNKASRIFNTGVGPQGQTVTLRNMSLTGGMTTQRGGAIFTGSYRTLNLVDSRVTGSFATNEGGGISTDRYEGCTINLIRSTVSGNTTGSNGAGVFNALGGTTTITDSALVNNFSYFGSGGGGHFRGSTTIRNSTISGNTASAGGGIALYSSGTTLTLRNSTITKNSTGSSGGGIFSGNLNIASTVISGNTSNGGTPDLSTSSVVTLNHSAVGNPAGFTFTGSNNLPAFTDLKLGLLANNGGPTLTHLQAADSPLVNAGSNPDGLATDQRGLSRVLNGQADIGAVEVVAAPLSLVVSNINDSGAGSLRQAILNANSLPGADTVSFDPTFFAMPRTITLGGTQLVLTDTTGATTIAGPGASLVTVSGNNLNRVLQVNSGVTAALIGVTIAGGKAADGGGIYSTGTLSLANARVTGSTATNIGGGIYSAGSLSLDNATIDGNTAALGAGVQSNGTLTVASSTFSTNKASLDGGALRLFGTATFANSTLNNNSATNNGGGVINHGTLTLSNSTVTSNTAIVGGGIQCIGTVTISNSHFASNKADYGGAIKSDATLTVSNTMFDQNAAMTGDGFGGAIWNNAPLTVIGSTFSKNASKTLGGAINSFQGLNIANSTFSNNTSALNGGALRLAGSADITGSTFSGNSATNDGGAIMSHGATTLTNSTLANNTASIGGGVYYFEGSGTMRNVTVAYNTSNNTAGNIGGGIQVGTAASVTAVNTIVAGNTAASGLNVGGSFTASSSNNVLNISAAAAGLGTLGGNGGLTQTIAILPNSPAINAGTSVGAPTTDQRGLPRAGATDIGAFELQATNNVLGVVINDGAAQRSRVTTVQVFFADPVSVASLGAIFFLRVGGGSVGTSSGLIVTPASGTVSSITMTFGNGPDTEFGSLRDGRWSFVLGGTGYTSPQFHRLFGDINGDGTVDGATDFAAFGNVFGATIAGSSFDFDNNGTIDGPTDFAQFGARFGLTL